MRIKNSIRETELLNTEIVAWYGINYFKSS